MAQPQNVVEHQHFFASDEQQERERGRFDACRLADGSAVVWNVDDDAVILATSYAMACDMARVMATLHRTYQDAALDACGEVIASFMRHDTLMHYRRERDENIPLDDPTSTGHYPGYLEEASMFMDRLRARGFSIVNIERTIATFIPRPRRIEEADT